MAMAPPRLSLAPTGAQTASICYEKRGTMHRLFLQTPLEAGLTHRCGREHANYLVNVLRLAPGAEILVFDGNSGEWRAEIVETGRGRCVLQVAERLRPQSDGSDLHFLFAPLKRARLDYMVQKATEMGVAAIQPVLTRRTNVARVNLARVRANAIEAAEQCGVLRVPEIVEPQKLDQVLGQWDHARRLIYCDEAAEASSPIDALAAVAPGPLAVLIGPEGGFEQDERKQLRGLPFVVPISLGPRVMRGDTAAVAALALVNAVLGDWC